MDQQPVVNEERGSGARHGARVAQRLQAGLLVDLKLGDRKLARRWQDAIRAGAWDPDLCAQELLGASGVDGDDPRLVERAGRLQRDLVMAPVLRGLSGAGRRARTSARRGLAYVVANLVAIGVYTLVLLAILLLVRLNYGFSVDGAIDAVLGLFGSAAEGP